MNLRLIFRRLVYTQVLLGLVASCMAERNPGLLLVAGAVGALSWYVTEGPAGRTLPRWGVNLGALAAVGLLAMELLSGRSPLLVAMAHFTMALQLLMLYAHKNYREYAQILVLSLLQMLGASVLSISMIYGLFLAAYCVVALLTLLYFQLAASADRVREANASAAPASAPVPRPPHTTGRTWAWQLRLTALGLGVACATIAVAVFVVFPRTGESRLSLEQVAISPVKQTGFSNTVRLDGQPLGDGSREPVLNFTVRSGEHDLGGSDRAWLVRGAALDHYNPESRSWHRSHFAGASDRALSLQDGVADINPRGESALGLDTTVTLRDSRQNTIFTVVPLPSGGHGAGPVVSRFHSEGLDALTYSPVDQQLGTTSAGFGAPVYRLRWPAAGDAAHVPGLDELSPEDLPLIETFGDDGDHRAFDLDWPSRRRTDPETYARRWAPEHDRVRGYALRILRNAGLDRDPDARHTPDDLRLAAALADHLRTTYAYTLDNPIPPPQQDPVVAFLFDTRRGHCELFAAGLTALCRSINIPARLVTGFMAVEYNGIGRYYVVRPTQAHAWTEVDGGPGVGWHTLDSTPPAPVAAEHAVSGGLFSGLRALYEHVEFAWIKSVVAFDQKTQKDVLQNVEATFNAASGRGKSLTATVKEWATAFPRNLSLDTLGYGGVTLIGFGLVLAVFTIFRLVTLRRRRLAALQLTSLPRAQRRGLVKRLAFYLTMIDMLERHGYARPAWQTPSEFARELAEANPLRFDPVIALTEVFYEVRFGHAPLDPPRRQRVRIHLKHLETAFTRRALT